MEAVGLYYHSTYRIIICLDHGVGVIPTGIETHLRNVHKEKGERLHAALREAGNYSSVLCQITNLPQLIHGTEEISGLAIQAAYHCKLAACNDEKQSLTIGATGFIGETI